jgi:hypothetical protein
VKPRLGILKDYKKKGPVEAPVRFFQRRDNEASTRWLPDAMLFPFKSNDIPPQEEIVDTLHDEHEDNLEELEEYDEAA